jgi:hypothetical protein
MSTTFTHTGTESAAQFIDRDFSQRIAPFGFPQIDWVSNTQLYSHYVANAHALHRRCQRPVSLHRQQLQTRRGNHLLRLPPRRRRLPRPPPENRRRPPRRADQRRGRRPAHRSHAQLPARLRRPPRPRRQRPPAHDPATNALSISRLTFLDRGLLAEKEYLRLFPSINASYNAPRKPHRPRRLLRSVGRPDFNQYAGGVTLPDTEAVPVAQQPHRRQQRPASKPGAPTPPTSASNTTSSGVGQISVGAFRRDFTNFFGTPRASAATPEQLSLYELDPATYGGFDVETQYNVPGTVTHGGPRASNYRQALTFLPPWARGVQVFANASSVRAHRRPSSAIPISISSRAAAVGA